MKSDKSPETLIALSVVSPCYNEGVGLTELHRRVKAVCDEFAGGQYEIVLVNDGSTDGTWQVICDLAGQDGNVVGVSLSRNHGHQLALTAGLHVSRGDRVLILDADLQDPPELLGQMMERMTPGIDVVYGRRISRAGETAFKKLSAKIFYRVLNGLIDVEIPTDTGDFRLMSRRAVDVLCSMPEKHRFVRGMVSWIGFQQEAFLYERSSRFAGNTKYSLISMIRFAFDAITAFSVRPLRWALYLGAIGATLGMVFIISVLIAWMAGETIQGWTSLTVLVLLMGSVQMLMIGIFGEYLGRMYIESKQRPLFVIDDIVTAAGHSVHAPTDVRNHGA
jgi:dolichol-phosphate mannosyltransferase